jgi:hypothetical protein
MSLSLAIAIVVMLDIALLSGLAYVMSRAKLLTPHVSATAVTAQRRRARTIRPAKRTARVRSTPIGVEG